MSDHSELKRLAEAATPQDFDSAQVATHEGWMECPTCGGEGSVDLGGDYLNYDNEALGVQFYGIGDAHVKAEAYYRAANPAAVLALIAENERYLKLVERMVDQYVPLTELEGVPGHSRVVELVEVVAERDQLKTEVEGLRAQHGRDSAELRSLCQARDDARKERDSLKAEVEHLREVMKLRDLALKLINHQLGLPKTDDAKTSQDAVKAISLDAERYRRMRAMTLAQTEETAEGFDSGFDSQLEAATGKGEKV